MSTPRFTSIADAKANGAICGFCRVTGAEKRLDVCARCKSAQYCSRDCQKKAWKYHKVICESGDEIRARLDKLAPQFGNNPSITKELHAQIETSMAVQKWCHRHRPVLFWACFNAYDLGRHPERGETHVMLVQLEQTGNAKRARSMFSVVDAYLLSREELMISRPQYMAMAAMGDREIALRENKDRVMSSVLLDYGSWAHWTRPLWDKEELAQRSTDPDWYTILKSITDGKTEFEMVNGNAVRKDANQSPDEVGDCPS